jgi:hypothetical protein
MEYKFAESDWGSKQSNIQPDSLGPYWIVFKVSSFDSHQHNSVLNSDLPSLLSSYMGLFLAFSMVNLLYILCTLTPLPLPAPLFTRSAFPCLCHGIGNYESLLLVCSWPQYELLTIGKFWLFIFVFPGRVSKNSWLLSEVL